MYIPPKPKSRFITGLGIALIIVSFKIIVIPLVYIFTLKAMVAGYTDQSIPPEEAEVVMHYALMTLGVLSLIGIITLVSAIGLFKRKNWGRLLVIGILSLAIASILSGIIAEWWMDYSIPPLAFKIISTILGGAFIFLLSWLIKTLTTEEIVHEFTQPADDFSPNDSFSL